MKIYSLFRYLFERFSFFHENRDCFVPRNDRKYTFLLKSIFTLRSSLFCILLCFSVSAYAQTAPANPAGYYSLNSKTNVVNGDTYGYFGTLKIQKVDSARIFVDLYVCKGAPSYSSGSLQDTLLYKNGIAVHTTTSDNSCVITFNFNTPDGVTIEEKTKDTLSGCGFGQGVSASGFYERIISYK